MEAPRTPRGLAEPREEARENPDLALVQIGQGQSFTAWEHGYPFHAVPWHVHPEQKIHQVAATAGRYFVGDFIGEFGPGNLVLTGLNLPHNWISGLVPGSTVPRRSRVVQFAQGFVTDSAGIFPELAALDPLRRPSRRGALFGAPTALMVAPMLEELVNARDLRRVELFVGGPRRAVARPRGAPPSPRQATCPTPPASCRRASMRRPPSSTTP